jgi:transmembrane sensor
MTTLPISESAAVEALREVPMAWDPARAEQRSLDVQELAARGDIFRARVRSVALAVSACAALALGGVIAVHLTSQRTLAPVTTVVERDVELTRFADGSTARVAEPSGHLSVQKATLHEVELALAAGSADFEVAPNPARSFVVFAGGVSVRVVGTRFRVERAGERVRVAVTRGKVEVRWPEGSSFLSVGESRWFPPESAAFAAALSVPAAAPSREPSPESVPQTRAARGQFLAHAREGAYAAAYALIAENPNLVGSSAEELMLAADAARLSGHPEQASVYLKRLLQQNGRDSRAPLAAFTLGRILLSQLGRPAQAADAFALARRLSPSGALGEDALAREAEAAFKAGNQPRGQALVKEYASAYPKGRSAATLEKGSGTGQP